MFKKCIYVFTSLCTPSVLSLLQNSTISVYWVFTFCLKRGFGVSNFSLFFVFTEAFDALYSVFFLCSISVFYLSTLCPNSVLIFSIQGLRSLSLPMRFKFVCTITLYFFTLSLSKECHIAFRQCGVKWRTMIKKLCLLTLF